MTLADTSAVAARSRTTERSVVMTWYTVARGFHDGVNAHCAIAEPVVIDHSP